jgi:OmpA-OmpF porin, OOP family
MNNLKKALFILLWCFPFLTTAQNNETAAQNWRPTNLVLNSSFETSADSAKPFTLYGSVTKAQGWTIPNKSQPLVYSTSDKGFIYDPHGTEWSFKARSGNNVAGINIYGSKRDYIQGSLTTPLVVGKKYYFAFWVHYHCSGASNIGIAFLPTKITMDSNTLIPLKPATYQKNIIPYSNEPKSVWGLVRDSFIAQLPLQSFIIGNFFTDANTKLEATKFKHYFAYIDDVAVWEAKVQPTTDYTTALEKEDWKRNMVIATPKNVAFTLNDVFFPYNSAVLESRSSLTLDSLVEKLNLLKTMKIHIMGHTSSEGSSDLNQKLSEKRAQAVMQYLINHGIENTRLSAEGLGSTIPITTNETEEGRKKNRRVVFMRIE